MSFDLLKQQLIAMSAIKGDSIASMIYSFVVLMIVEQIFKFLPLLETFMKKKLESYFNDATQSIASSVGQNLNLSIAKEKTSSIYFTRIYENNKSSEGPQLDLNSVGVHDRTDCLIELITNLDKSKHVSYNMMFYVRHHEVIEITNKIMFQVKKFTDSDKGLSKLEFEIFSYDLTLAELHDFVNKIIKENKMQKQNKLGTQLYYFNEIIKPLQTYNGKPLYESAPKMIPFTMTKFFTNKNLYNVYGESFKVVKDRVHFFMNNEDWYKHKGIPHTLGILVSGPPGSGKTSCIKAIANTTKRHIINISFNEFTTKTQLRNLFYDEKLLVEKGNQFEQLIIPCDKRIYVIEDVDCLTDVVLDRSIKEQKEKEKRLKELKVLTNQEEKKQDSTSDQLNLSFILNLFDGVLETPGRILIMSSNYPEKIDKALIRPGRIDLNIIFGYCSRETIEEIITSNYDINSNELKKYDFAENEYTPAEISQILFNNIHKKEEGLKMLLKENIETTRKMYNIPKHVQQVEIPELDIRDVNINSPTHEEEIVEEKETLEEKKTPTKKHINEKTFTTIDELFLDLKQGSQEEKVKFGSMQLL